MTIAVRPPGGGAALPKPTAWRRVRSTWRKPRRPRQPDEAAIDEEYSLTCSQAGHLILVWLGRRSHRPSRPAVELLRSRGTREEWPVKGQVRLCRAPLARP